MERGLSKVNDINIEKFTSHAKKSEQFWSREIDKNNCKAVVSK
jgi:hypothetical protein